MRQATSPMDGAHCTYRGLSSGTCEQPPVDTHTYVYCNPHGGCVVGWGVDRFMGVNHLVGLWLTCCSGTLWSPTTRWAMGVTLGCRHSDRRSFICSYGYEGASWTDGVRDFCRHGVCATGIEPHEKRPVHRGDHSCAPAQSNDMFLTALYPERRSRQRQFSISR